MRHHQEKIHGAGLKLVCQECSHEYKKKPHLVQPQIIHDGWPGSYCGRKTGQQEPYKVTVVTRMAAQKLLQEVWKRKCETKHMDAHMIGD